MKYTNDFNSFTSDRQMVQCEAMNINGVVIEGDGYGKKLGFPTANIDRDDYQSQGLNVEYGVYIGSVSAEIWDVPKRAGIVIGPEDAWGLPKLEAHILDFEGDLYGERLTFHLGTFLRPYREYTGEIDLQNDIAADIEKIKNSDICLPE